MAASLNRPTRIEDNDLVTVPNRGQPMSHDEAATSSSPEALVDLGFHEGV